MFVLAVVPRKTWMRFRWVGVLFFVMATTALLHAPGGIIGSGRDSVDKERTIHGKLSAVLDLLEKNASSGGETLISCCHHIMGDANSSPPTYGIIGSDSGGTIDTTIDVMGKLQLCVSCLDSTSKPAPTDFLSALKNIQGESGANPPTYGIIGPIESKREDTVGKLTDFVKLIDKALKDTWKHSDPPYKPNTKPATLQNVIEAIENAQGKKKNKNKEEGSD